jgi:hypothetical protein
VVPVQKAIESIKVRSDIPHTPNLPEPVKRLAVQAAQGEESEEIGTPRMPQNEKEPAKVVSVKVAQPEEQKHGAVLLLIIGIFAVLGIATTVMLRRRG